VDRTRQSFLFVLHDRETLSAGLLNSPNKQEACVTNGKRDVNLEHLLVRNKLSVQHWRQWNKAEEVCDFSTTDWGPISTPWKICRDDLSLLSVAGIARRYAFEREYGAPLDDNQSALNVTRFSSEAHFHMYGNINKQNVRFWASEYSRLTVANSLHPERERESYSKV
jgi:hypothetical protein